MSHRAVTLMACLALYCCNDAGSEGADAIGDAGVAVDVDVGPPVDDGPDAVACPADCVCVLGEGGCVDIDAVLDEAAERVYCVRAPLAHAFTLRSPVTLRGCGDDPVAITGDGGAPVISVTVEGGAVTLENLALSADLADPDDAPIGVVDRREGGTLTLKTVELSGFETAVLVQPPLPDGGISLRLEGVTMVGNGEPGQVGPDDGDRARFGGLRMIGGAALAIDDALIADSLGDALRVVDVAEVTLESSVLRDNLGGASISESPGGDVSLMITDVRFEGHVGERQAPDGLRPVPALGIRVSGAEIERAHFIGSRLGLISEGGRVSLEDSVVDAAGLDVPSMGVVVGCTDLDLVGTDILGTTDVGVVGFGSVGANCGRIPQLKILGGRVEATAGLAIAALGIDGIIVMNGCCGTVDYGIAAFGAELVIGAGNTLAATGTLLHVEEILEEESVADPGLVFLTEDEPPVSDELVAQQLGEAEIRGCDEACQRALEGRFGLELAAPSLPGGALPQVEAAAGSAAAALNGARTARRPQP